MNKKIVICSRFNYSEYDLAHSIYYKVTPLDPEWIKHRMEIFMKYTCKSLMSQTNQDFLAVLTAYDESMPVITELLSHYPPLPDNIRFIPHSQKSAIIQDYIKDSDLLYLVRIDSDDVYVSNYIQRMHDYIAKPETSTIVCTAGYIYSDQEDLLAIYSNRLPCFYTQIFTVADYLNVYQYYPELSHDVAYKFPCERLSSTRNFIIIIHNANTWQKFTDRYTKDIISDPQQKQQIMKSCGLS